MLDPDHFEQVNDRYGRLIGDGVRKRAVLTSRACLRSEDLLGRFGGGESAFLAQGKTLPVSAVSPFATQFFADCPLMPTSV